MAPKQYVVDDFKDRGENTDRHPEHNLNRDNLNRDNHLPRPLLAFKKFLNWAIPMLYQACRSMVLHLYAERELWPEKSGLVETWRIIRNPYNYSFRDLWRFFCGWAVDPEMLWGLGRCFWYHFKGAMYAVGRGGGGGVGSGEWAGYAAFDIYWEAIFSQYGVSSILSPAIGPVVRDTGDSWHYYIFATLR
ncbi:Uu.00g032180.m01.CDS01 [Anthostomella pinea]|uniref:Uu.00g032180.m01.CDS01 n=1 Tax=Anthostomella pinea TaxID=933095 RepID=A0AAI8V9M6_9PEZI|nr:Uu.00g032180.m01.CDS01 [Anthostomella pinea]